MFLIILVAAQLGFSLKGSRAFEFFIFVFYACVFLQNVFNDQREISAKIRKETRLKTFKFVVGFLKF